MTPLETTLPSSLFARPRRDLILAGQPEATREGWDEKRPNGDLFVSVWVSQPNGTNQTSLLP